MIFRHPQKNIYQYLLLPIRVILFVPLLISVMLFVLLVNAFKALFALISFGILLGIGWLIDNYLWPGFSRTGFGELIGVIAFFPLWFGVAWALGFVTTGLRKAMGVSASVGKYWDWIMDFMFEAKYQDSPYELYGPTFPKPKFEDFNLVAEEYHDYHRRFSLGGFEFGISVASAFIAGFIASYYFPELKYEHKFVIGIATALVVLPSVILFEQWYSRTYPQYERVRNYDKAEKIYESIQTELQRLRIKEEFDKKCPK